MTHQLSKVTFAFLVCVAQSGSGRAEDAPAKTVKDLQGTWKLASVEGDEQSREPLGGPVNLAIKGNKLVYGGEEIATLTVDSAASPKTIDLKFTNPDRVYEGVYVVENAKLKICLNCFEGAKDRPTSFSTKDQPDWRLLSFESVKDATDVGKEKLTGFVGLMLKPDEDTKEVVVVTPLKGSPADKAGFRPDDVLLKIGGAAVADLQGAINTVRKAKPSDKLEFIVRRGKEEKTITVTVGVLPFALVAGLR